MKIKKVRIKNLLKLHLLKSKVYEQPTEKMKFNNLIDNNLNQIIVDLKKVLRVIFQYHQTDKRILFVGFPDKLESKVNKLTQHVAVPYNFDIQGMISNYNRKSLRSDRISDQIRSKNHLKFLLPKLSKKLDLIVLLHSDKKEIILSEAKSVKVPVIVIGTDVASESSDKVLYSVEGNFKNTIYNTNIFFICLNFLFKKKDYYKKNWNQV